MKTQKIFTKPTKYLIFTGGGARGLSFIGAIRELEKFWGTQFWLELEGIIAVSIGSLIACLLSIGFTSDELLEIGNHFPFERLLSPQVDNLFEKFGCDSGQQIVAFLTSCFNRKQINPSITFKEFYEQTNINLQVTVSNLHLGKAEFWCAETTPDCPVITGIRASTAIPFIFEPVQYKNALYVDGGYFAPFPYAYLPTEILEESYGIYITSNIEKDQQFPDYPENLWDYFQFCFASSRRFLVRGAWEHPFWKNTIVLNVGEEVRISDFELTPELREALLSSGVKGVQKHFLRKTWDLFTRAASQSS